MVNLTTHKDFKSLKRGDKFKYVLSVIGAVIVSLYLLIAGIMFPVLISQKTAPKASAASSSSVYASPYIPLSSNIFVTFWVSNGGSEVDVRATAIWLASDSSDCEVDNSLYPGYISFEGYYVIVSYVDTDNTNGIFDFEPFSVSYNQITSSDVGLTDVLTSLDDQDLTDYFSDGAFLFECLFYQEPADSFVSVRLYFPINEYTSSFTLGVNSADVISDTTDVWTSIGSWLSATVNNVVSVFYVDGNLTFLGILALVALGISLFFLLMGLLEGFIHLRG